MPRVTVGFDRAGPSSVEAPIFPGLPSQALLAQTPRRHDIGVRRDDRGSLDSRDDQFYDGRKPLLHRNRARTRRTRSAASYLLLLATAPVCEPTGAQESASHASCSAVSALLDRVCGAELSVAPPAGVQQQKVSVRLTCKLAQQHMAPYYRIGVALDGSTTSSASRRRRAKKSHSMFSIAAPAYVANFDSVGRYVFKHSQTTTRAC
jgi:hypothetical protein